jgi:hypothetical protein
VFGTLASERDRLGRALADAGAALDALITDLGSTVDDFDRSDRAGTDASFASNTFLFVNLGSHFSPPE